MQSRNKIGAYAYEKQCIIDYWVRTEHVVSPLLSTQIPQSLSDVIIEFGSNVTLEYESDFDQNGVLYYLGTNGYTMDWTNPGESGSVKVTASTAMVDSAPMTAVVGRETVRAVTQPARDQWICVDFSPSEVNIIPSHYTLRHYSTWDTEALRFWKLEGSIDGSEWDTLMTHNDDRSLDKRGGTHTWQISARPGIKAYSQFRIFQTGLNSNNHYYLACSGLEIYGELQYGFSHLSALKTFGATQLHSNTAAIIDNRTNESQRRADIHRSLHSTVIGRNFKYNSQCIVDYWVRREKVSSQLGDEIPQSLSDLIIQFGSFVTAEYQSDFDTNGVVYYLGTDGFKRDWINPGESGAVNVTASTVMHDSQPLTAAVGRESVRCATQPKKDAWMKFDFSPSQIAIIPSHYTLRHYSTWDTEALRNWEFEGSVDGRQWDTIMTHSSDVSLDKKGGTHTWQIDAGPDIKAYSRFRISQTGYNSNHHYYLACSGFEIYGVILYGTAQASDLVQWSMRDPKPVLPA